jgi:glutamate-1-semialdehyde 2,1-aminomutase
VKLRDIDGNRYIDYALAFGPMLLGHSPEPVLSAVREQLTAGIGYGASHPLEAKLAEAICRTVPCAERVIISNTGSEAVHVALRLARAATGRAKIVKFAGHYDGWFDSVHIGTPGVPSTAPSTAGQDPQAAANTIVCPWNDLAALERALAAGDVAAVIMEPLAVNAGCIPPASGYLEGAREATRRCGSLLIFDEVITGYRLALGGAQERYGVMPDLAVLGKALGAGFPISAVCGRAELFADVSSGRMAHVGTFNANPVCAAAATAAIAELERNADSIYPALDRHAAELAAIITEEGKAAGVPLVARRDVGVVHAFVSDRPIDTADDAACSDAAAYRVFAGALLRYGVHVIPRGLLYLSACHGDDEIGATRLAVRLAAHDTAAWRSERP